MSRKYKFYNPTGAYFVTFAVQEWIEVFKEIDYINILVESLEYCQKHKGLEIYAWCIMTNHVHLLVRAVGDNLLQDILRDFKKYTSKVIVKAIKSNEDKSNNKWLIEKFITLEGIRFWRPDNKPIEVWSIKITYQKLNYIHRNPVKAGFVQRPEEYLYSSAVDYSGGRGLLDIVIID